MTPIRFGEIADKNFGFRRVAYELTLHFRNNVPGGISVFFNYFLDRMFTEPRIHTPEETESFSKIDDDNLCFIPWMNLSISGVQMDVNKHTKSKEDPCEVLKRIISEAPNGANLLFGNIFIVRYNPQTTVYSTQIHRYLPTFFQMRVLEDPELLELVVRKCVRINNVQLELPREALTSDFTD